MQARTATNAAAAPAAICETLMDAPAAFGVTADEITEEMLETCEFSTEEMELAPDETAEVMELAAELAPDATDEVALATVEDAPPVVEGAEALDAGLEAGPPFRQSLPPG